jgi:hypothetical protein
LANCSKAYVPQPHTTGKLLQDHQEKCSAARFKSRKIEVRRCIFLRKIKQKKMTKWKIKIYEPINLSSFCVAMELVSTLLEEDG